MRKLYTILILMFLVFGLSSVIAQENPTEEIVAVSSGGGSSGSLVSVHDTEEITSTPIAMTEVTSTSGGGSGFSISSYAQGRCSVDEEKLDKLTKLVTQIRDLSEIKDKEKLRYLVDGNA